MSKKETKLKNQKISDKHYNDLKSLLDDLSKVQSQIGVLETSKHELLHEVSVLKVKLSELQVELKEDYGDIIIDVSDGSYTTKEQ